MSTYLLKLGTYTLPVTFYPSGKNTPYVVPSMKGVRGDQNRAIRGSHNLRKFTLRGGLVSGPIGGVTIQTVLDAIYLAFFANTPANLYLADNDRYWRNVQCEDVREVYDPNGYGYVVAVEVDLICPDPYAYSTTTSTATWTPSGSGDTKNVTGAGVAYNQPTISLTVGGSGAKTIAWTLENTSTGKSFTLTGNVTGGDVIVVDCLNQTVTIGGVDKMSLFGGQWLDLRAGTDTFAITYGAATCSDVSFAWQNRYL